MPAPLEPAGQFRTARPAAVDAPAGCDRAQQIRAAAARWLARGCGLTKSSSRSPTIASPTESRCRSSRWARHALAIWAYRHLLTVDMPKFIEPLASTINERLQIRLVVVALDVVAVGARVMPPIEQADVVAVGVRAKLGEVGAAALVRRAMLAGKKAVDDRSWRSAPTARAWRAPADRRSGAGSRSGLPLRRCSRRLRLLRLRLRQPPRRCRSRSESTNLFDPVLATAVHLSMNLLATRFNVRPSTTHCYSQRRPMPLDERL